MQSQPLSASTLVFHELFSMVDFVSLTFNFSQPTVNCACAPLLTTELCYTKCNTISHRSCPVQPQPATDKYQPFNMHHCHHHYQLKTNNCPLLFLLACFPFLLFIPTSLLDFTFILKGCAVCQYPDKCAVSKADRSHT